MLHPGVQRQSGDMAGRFIVIDSCELIIPQGYPVYPSIVHSAGAFSDQHGAHLGPTGPSWAPCWPHELCYLGCCDLMSIEAGLLILILHS